MITISTQQNTILVEENILTRISDIFVAANDYGLYDLIKKKLEINISSDNSKIEYNLVVPKAFFDNYPDFQMKLFEKGFTVDIDVDKTHLRSYSYHGFHCIPGINPNKDHFIRFDFEPFKRDYAPVHINTPQQWGDHLVYPDSTNLDISKMNCSIALQVFLRYAKDKDDYPVNQNTNNQYVGMFENGGFRKNG